MTHLIEIRKSCMVDLQPPGNTRLERMKVKAGEILEGHVKCYVKKLVELADIALVDGTGILCGVPCEAFMFLDRRD